MSDLMKEQLCFLRLFVQTTPRQRKVLLDTATPLQLKALSEIAHNITKGNVTLTTSEQTQLKRDKRLIHLLGDKKLGYKHKQRLVLLKQRTLYILIKIALTYLEPALQ